MKDVLIVFSVVR